MIIFTEYKYHKMLIFVLSGIEFFLEFQLQKKLAHRHGFSSIFLEIFGFLKYRLPLYTIFSYIHINIQREKKMLIFKVHAINNMQILGQMGQIVSRVPCYADGTLPAWGLSLSNLFLGSIMENHQQQSSSENSTFF